MRTLMLALLAVMVAVIAGCLKTETPNYDCSTVTTTAPSNEVTALQTYIDTNKITATKDSRGFFYNIDSTGSTSNLYPTTCSDVKVAYVGKLTSGVTIDSQSVAAPVTFGLYNNLITGWKEAIPLMKVGSTMNLYLPPSLGYGSTGYGAVPGNAILIFRIQLIAAN